MFNDATTRRAAELTVVPLLKTPQKLRHRNLAASLMAENDQVSGEYIAALTADGPVGRADFKDRIIHQHPGPIREAWSEPCTDKCLFLHWVPVGEQS